MALSTGEVRLLLTARDEASGVLGKLGGSLGSLTKLAATATAALGASFVAGAGAAVKSAADLQEAVAAVAAIKPEIDTSGVTTSLNRMSSELGVSSTELASSLYNVFSSVDVAQSDALALTEQFAKGAIAAQTDAATFGTAILGVMNAYKLSADDATHVSDVFFNTVNKGVVTGEELAHSLGQVTQGAKNAGVSFDELGALIAGVTKEGGGAGTNINNLNNLFAKLPTADVAADLADLGIATKTATGEFRPILDVLADLKGHLDTLSEADRAQALQDLFPDIQARTGLATLLSQLDFVKQTLDANAASAGSAQAAFTTMTGTFNHQLQVLGATVQAQLATLGARLLPILTPLLGQLTAALPAAVAAAVGAFESVVPVAEAAFGWARENLWPPFLAAAQAALGWLSDTALPAIAAAAHAAFDWLIGTALPALQAAAAAAAPEVERLAAAFGAFVAGGGPAAAVADLAKQVQDALAPALVVLRPLAEQLLASLRNLADVARAQLGPVLRELRPLLEALAPLLGTVLVGAAAALLVGLRELANFLAAVLPAAARATIGVIRALTIAIRTIDAAVTEAVAIVRAILAGDWAAAWQGAKDLAVTLITGLNAEVTNLLQTLADAILALLDAFVPGWRARWQSLIDIVAPIPARIHDAVVPAVQGVVDDLLAAIDGLIGGWSAAWASVAGAATGAIAAMRGAVDGLIGAISSLLGAIARIPSSISVPTVPSPAAIGVPSFAHGGVVPGPAGKARVAIVHGGEVVVPPGAFARAAGAFAGGVLGGGPTVVVQITGDIYGFDDFRARVAAAVEASMRAGGLQIVARVSR